MDPLSRHWHYVASQTLVSHPSKAQQGVVPKTVAERPEADIGFNVGPLSRCLPPSGLFIHLW